MGFERWDGSKPFSWSAADTKSVLGTLGLVMTAAGASWIASVFVPSVSTEELKGVALAGALTVAVQVVQKFLTNTEKKA